MKSPGGVDGMQAKDNQSKMKAPAALSTRKPPEPADGHSAIDDWMRRSMPDLQPILRLVDEVICGTIPDLQFAVKWKKAYYGSPEHGWLIELVAYDVSANVVFFAGADLNPPPPLGSEGRSRYVKLKTVEEARDPSLRGWIQQAGRVPGWR